MKRAEAVGKHTLELTFLLAVVLCLGNSSAWAELKPEQIAVLANGKFAGSVELARYYCQNRHVPLSNIIVLDMPEGERIGRVIYDKIALQIRQALEDLPQSQDIRCILTVRGVPLRISRSLPSPEQMEVLKKLREEMEKNLGELETLRLQVRSLAGLGPIAAQATAKKKSLQKRWLELSKEVPLELVQARQRVRKLSESSRKQAAIRQYMQLEEDLVGLTAKLYWLKSQGAEFQKLQEQLRQADEQIALLLRPIATAEEIDKARELIRLSRGLLGLIQQQNVLINVINRPHEASSSSFDSELSMLLAGDYPLKGPLLNPMRLGVQVPAKLRSIRILMVSRIDAPTDGLARGLIDKAIRTESVGLTGRAYIDTGWTKAKKDGYGKTEQSLLDTAKLLRQYGLMPVTVDRTREVFGPGSCPQAGLYCGWYSLSKYVDAFSWVDGAVGYHIASLEAHSLRNPTSTGWASAMIRDGITATLGPVEEPYLASFPQPHEFFSILLTGKFSLVECYYMTKGFNSWRMVLIGDPLYRPFARNPRLSIAEAERIIKHTLPVGTHNAVNP